MGTGMPLGTTLVSLLEQNFLKYYSIKPSDSSTINPLETSKKVNIVMSELAGFMNIGNLPVNITDTQGLVLHYTIDNYESLQDRSGTKYILSYILSLGVLVNGNVTYQPFKKDSEEYYLRINNEGSGSNFKLIKINNANFEAITNFYADTIRAYTDFPVPRIIPASRQSVLPKKCFFSNGILNLFFSNNTEIPRTYLYIAPGATSVENGSNVFYGQTPVLKWGDSNGPAGINDIFDGSEPFDKKALDVGRLCPPQCGTNQPDP